MVKEAVNYNSGNIAKCSLNFMSISFSDTHPTVFTHQQKSHALF